MDAAKIRQIIEGYQNALVADAVSPQPDYKLNDKMVTRSAWREGLQKMIVEWQKQLNALEPYLITTKQVL